MLIALSAITEAIPFLVFFGIVVVMSIVGAVNKKKLAEKARQNSQTEPKKAEVKNSADSEHDEIIKRRMEMQNKSKKPVKNVYANRHESSEGKTVQKPVEKTPIEKERVEKAKLEAKKKQLAQTKKPQQAKHEEHAHPVEATPARKEIRPSSAGSLGEVHDEGCYDHDDARYVLEEVQTADSEADAGLKELQRVMVWSEILDKPKFKR